MAVQHPLKTRPEESFMFDALRNFKAVMITMGSPQAWGYLGTNGAAPVAEPA